MPTNLSGTVRPKTFDRITRYPLLYIRFSDTIFFSEKLQGCSQNFSVLWDHIFSTAKCDPFPFFNRKNFSKPETFSKTVGSLYRNFRQCEANFFRRKFVTPKLCIKLLDTRKFLKRLSKAHANFPHCETENCWQNYVVASIMHKYFRLPQNVLKHWRDANQFVRHCKT